MKKLIRSYLFLALISLPLLALDQYTKWLIRTNLSVGETWMPLKWLEPYARFVFWHNTGVAFGMFQNGGVILAIIAALVAVGILIYYPRVPENDWTLRVAMGLMLTGAVGNLIDRLTIGYVTDFISVGTFAVFNVADSCITIGVFILILGVWIQERREKAKAKIESNKDKPADSSTAEHFEMR